MISNIQEISRSYFTWIHQLLYNHHLKFGTYSVEVSFSTSLEFGRSNDPIGFLLMNGRNQAELSSGQTLKRFHHSPPLMHSTPLTAQWTSEFNNPFFYLLPDIRLQLFISSLENSQKQNNKYKMPHSKLTVFN